MLKVVSPVLVLVLGWYRLEVERVPFAVVVDVCVVSFFSECGRSVIGDTEAQRLAALYSLFPSIFSCITFP